MPDLSPSTQDAVDRFNDRLAFSPAEFAAVFGITRQHVYKLMADGTIHSFKLGRRRLISRAEATSLPDRLGGAA